VVVGDFCAGIRGVVCGKRNNTKRLIKSEAVLIVV
jgi:hypothetical protein